MVFITSKSTRNQPKFSFLLLFGLFLLVCYFPIFHHLEILPLQAYDESRLANSAIEMLENGNYLIPHFLGKPDMWSTKPPLMIWLQTIGMKIFGVGELAVRLPAALSTLAIVLLLFFFCAKYLQNRTLGFLSGLILITSQGFITDHVSRTGDYDTLVTFFNTAALLLIFLFTQVTNQRQKRKYLYLTAVCLILAVYTKSVVGLLFLPGIFLYLLTQKKLLPTLKTKETYFSILGVVFFIGGYYLLREYYNPGYLQAVSDNELGGRYASTLENHKHPFFWYFEKIGAKKFVPWVYLLPLGVAIGWQKKGMQKSLVVLLSLIIVSFLLIISIAQTKIHWYDCPVYPAMSLLAAIALTEIYERIKQPNSYKIIAIALIFAYPYFTILKKTYLPKPEYVGDEFGLFMRQLKDHKSYKIARMGPSAHLLFYRRMYHRQGFEIEERFPTRLQIGDKAVCCEQRIGEILDEKFDYKTIYANGNCKFVEILGFK